jgi:SAM-dependent methyltransferase
MDFDAPDQAEAYDRWYATPLGDWVDRCEKKAVFALLPPVTGLRILDAGCGTGNFSLTLAAREAVMVGVDRSPVMLSQTRGKRWEGRHFRHCCAWPRALSGSGIASFLGPRLFWQYPPGRNEVSREPFPKPVARRRRE